MARRKNGNPKVVVLLFLLGVLIGNLGSQYCTSNVFTRCGLPDFCCPADLGMSDGSGQREEPEAERQDEQTGRDRDNFVFVGIMTAKKFIDNRGLASHRTWASRTTQWMRCSEF